MKKVQEQKRFIFQFYPLVVYFINIAQLGKKFLKTRIVPLSVANMSNNCPKHLHIHGHKKIQSRSQISPITV